MEKLGSGMRGVGLATAAGLAAIATVTLAEAEARATPGPHPAACVGARPALAPEVVPLRGTQSAPANRGTMTLTQPGSPFEITVNDGGFQTFDVEIRAEQLRRRPGGAYVAWAAKPELGEWVRLGVVPESNRVSGRIAWNQFLVFVSEEPEADPTPERWRGPIVLTGTSPSGRLHTMAGHGPFEDVSCQQYF